jgi:hypothetical protein
MIFQCQRQCNEPSTVEQGAVLSALEEMVIRPAQAVKAFPTLSS